MVVYMYEYRSKISDTQLLKIFFKLSYAVTECAFVHCKQN